MKIAPRIDRMVNKGKVKAIASVSLDGMFVVKNLKIMDGKKGLFVSMPQESYPGKDGQTKYSNTFFALTNSAKMQLQEVVLGHISRHCIRSSIIIPKAMDKVTIPRNANTSRKTIRNHNTNPSIPNPSTLSGSMNVMPTLKWIWRRDTDIHLSICLWLTNSQGHKFLFERMTT